MKFTRNDLDHLHDTVLDAIGQNEPDEKLIERFNALPENIKAVAEQWGCNDTDFGSQFYQYLVSKND